MKAPGVFFQRAQLFNSKFVFHWPCGHVTTAPGQVKSGPYMSQLFNEGCYQHSGSGFALWSQAKFIRINISIISISAIIDINAQQHQHHQHHQHHITIFASIISSSTSAISMNDHQHQRGTSAPSPLSYLLFLCSCSCMHCTRHPIH